ncbi:hypothetical protein [Azospirillum doebereinerae]
MDDGTHPTPTIRSASEERSLKAGLQGAKPPRAPLSQAFAATASHAARRISQQPKPWSSQISGAGEDQNAPDVGRTADRTRDRAMENGSAMMPSGYGMVFSEALTFMSRAVERQNEMLNGMLHARRPQDIMLVGNRYLLGGWFAGVEFTVRIAQAASGLRDDVKRSPARRGG